MIHGVKSPIRQNGTRVFVTDKAERDRVTLRSGLQPWKGELIINQYPVEMNRKIRNGYLRVGQSCGFNDAFHDISQINIVVDEWCKTHIGESMRVNAQANLQ